MSPGRTKFYSGGEGGIRTHDRLDGSASCRFCFAHNAKLAVDAVDHCTLLHAGTTLEGDDT